ncbi:uncharacterized protein LOC7474562 isoform X2 [Populus trichocarpa]|uniref:uncharacterized protein LOC7474562 isoform X2 n=1 Tax=Populus trichocarpa TaxID=3694 RepID=UPI000D187D5C|nr:uncharacterized protein LOC7474562 isoform X2 [Populus trichocarpa]XP_024451521.1 uncharacterized protein LOC7474562 isoform X2 [Populus trichocarpa]XP_024451522.1 uncharacterized protein LOC7474562 isoform X2 [Populus trichocarpa]|eukprot:XP_024451519.1 uncharacterized protein LOC7474562 isoform X1 [Populus trichocarpa]
MRHRLDSKGQRKGKVDSKRYEWVRVDSWDNLSGKNGIGTPKEFLILAFLGCGITSFSLVNWPTLLVVMLMVGSNSAYKQEAKAYSKDLSSYCGRLLEETEDELAELIKKGSVKVGRLSKILCQDLSKHCKQSSDSHEVDADDDEPDGEL